MAHVIWVYAEVIDDKLTPTTLEMLTKAAEVGTAEAVLLGPAPEDAAQTLANYGASKIYHSADPVFGDFLTLPAVETIAGGARSSFPTSYRAILPEARRNIFGTRGKPCDGG